MSDNKFKPYQKVYALGVVLNGTRMDVTGMVERYTYSYHYKKYKYEVIVNTVRLLLDEERLVAYEDYEPSKKDSANE